MRNAKQETIADIVCENRYSCHICGERYRMKCVVAWAQMPYEKGAEDEDK